MKDGKISASAVIALANICNRNDISRTEWAKRAKMYGSHISIFNNLKGDDRVTIKQFDRLFNSLSTFLPGDIMRREIVKEAKKIKDQFTRIIFKCKALTDQERNTAEVLFDTMLDEK